MRKTNNVYFVHPFTNTKTVMQIANTELPFGNNFVQQSATWDPVAQEINCVVRCTKNSWEPKRLYSIGFTLQGLATGCCTIN